MKKAATKSDQPTTTGPQKFRTTILSTGKTAAGIKVPPEIVAALGTSKKPPVRATINGYTYRSTIAFMGGEFWLGVSNDVRQKAGVAAGETIDIELELDTQPRVVNVPPDLAAALKKNAAAKKFFDGLSYSNKSRHVLSVEGAKTEETRKRRIEKVVEMMKEGKV